MALLWIAERTAHPRFAVRIRIERDGRVLFAFRAQHPWPGPGAQVFCLREREPPEPAESLEEFERVPVRVLDRLGPKLSLTLDRANRKRCEFLILAKPYKDGSGVYEQVFFRTESGVRAHKSRGRVVLRAPTALAVAIDSAERYPWTLPGAAVVRRKLAAGDYALLRDEAVVAVVERKTGENLLGDFSQLQALHQQLRELGATPHAAVVVEANYGDFLDPKRLGDWSPTHVTRVLAELAVLHPRVQWVFAGNRKQAAYWTHRFFLAAGSAQETVQPLLLRETPAEYAADLPLDTRIRRAALERAQAGFTFVELRALFAGDEAPPTDERLRRVLNALRGEGRLACSGRGVAARWAAACPDPAARQPPGR